MDDEYQAYMLSSALGDPTGGYGGMPDDTIYDPISPGITQPDYNDPLGGDLPPVNPPDAVDPNDPLGGGTPPRDGGIPTDLKNLLRGLIVGADGKVNPMGAFGIAALMSTLGLGRSSPAPVGYQGGIPRYTAVRQQVPMPVDPNRRPGSAGRRYFTDTQYVPTPSSPTDTSVETARTAAREQAKGLTPAITTVSTSQDKKNDAITMGPPAPKKEGSTAKPSGFSDFYKSPEYANYVSSGLNTIGTMDMYDSPYFGMISGGGTGRALDDAYKTYLGRTGTTPVFAPRRSGPVEAAQGGLMGLAKGRYLNGSTDGMADKIPANIDGKQEARLSHGEFVIPADVVSHLGNGNSEAGAQELYSMMDRIRKARTGNPKQGKQIAPSKYLPS